VYLEALPLTPNGKLDRRALPAPDRQAQVEVTYVTPQTSLERCIAAVWQDTLRRDDIGIHDNFFDLGGHSLALVQVHGKLRTLLPTALTIVNLFEYPTIGALARYLEAGSTPTADQSLARAAARQRAMGTPRQRQ
jgi:acyl carrier protein